MVRLFAAAVVALAAAVIVGLCGIAEAGPDQSLTIDLSSAQPRIDHLAAYASDTPVHIRVLAPRIDRVAIKGSSPDGTAVDVLLARGSDGVFAGDLPLGTTGDWSLAVDSALENDDALTDHFTLTSVDPPSTNTAGVMIALGGASVFGGVGLLALGRRAALRSTPSHPSTTG